LHRLKQLREVIEDDLDFEQNEMLNILIQEYEEQKEQGE
jgi:hypothetical protein